MSRRNINGVRHPTPQMNSVDDETLRSFSSKKSETAKPVPSIEKRPKKRKSFTDFCLSLSDTLHGKILAFNLDKELLLRSVIAAALLILMAVFQTSFAARFKLFGATPDLMLGLVVAISMTEGPKFGAFTGLFAGLIIDALGNVSPALSPLLYVPVGIFCALLTELYVTRSIPVRAVFTVAVGVPRALLSLVQLELYHTVPLGRALVDSIFPEYLATVFAALLPHFLAWITLRSFHKTRAEKVK